MQSKIIIILFCFFNLVTIFSQTLEKEKEFTSSENYNTTEGSCLFVTSKNEILSVYTHTRGNSFWSGYGYSSIVKMDKDGNILLEKELPIFISTLVSTFTELSNGNFVLTSKTDSDGSVFLLDDDLNILWSKYYGDKGNGSYYFDRLVNTIETSDGNLLSIGSSGGLSNGQASLYLSKVNMNGVILWSKTFGLGGDEDGSDVVEIDGFYYAFGYGTGYYGATIPLLIKVNENGDLIWGKVLKGNTAGGNCREINVVDDDKLLLTFEDAITSSIDNWTKSDIFVVKMDTSASVTWATRSGSDTYNKVASTKVDKEGNIFVSGFLDYDTTYRLTSSLKETIPFLLKLDSDGGYLLSNVYDNPIMKVAFLSSSLYGNIAIGKDKLYMQYSHDSLNSTTEHETLSAHLKILDKNGRNSCSQPILFPTEKGTCQVIDVTNSLDVLSGRFSLDLSLVFQVSPTYNETISCVDVSSVKEIEFEDLILYPNPTNGNDLISFNKEIISFELVNMVGELVLSSINDNPILDVSILNPGSYVVKAKTKRGDIAVQKLIVR